LGSPASPTKSKKSCYSNDEECAEAATEARAEEAAETAEKAAFYTDTEAHLLAQAVADVITSPEWELADGKVPRDQMLDWAYKLISVRQPPLAIEIEARVAASLKTTCPRRP
jgi:hypothetical protein